MSGGGSGPYYAISAEIPQGQATDGAGFVVGFLVGGCCSSPDATTLSGSGSASWLVVSTGLWTTQPAATISWNLTRTANVPALSFVQQPASNATIGKPFSVQPKVAVHDAGGTQLPVTPRQSRFR